MIKHLFHSVLMFSLVVILVIFTKDYVVFPFLVMTFFATSYIMGKDIDNLIE